MLLAVHILDEIWISTQGYISNLCPCTIFLIVPGMYPTVLQHSILVIISHGCKSGHPAPPVPGHSSNMQNYILNI